MNILLYIPFYLFIKGLKKYNNLPFTNLYIFSWNVFAVINILEKTQILDTDSIHGLYAIADLLCKILCNIVVSKYNERELLLQKNIDLQCVNFISYNMKKIKEYEDNHAKITNNCKELIKSTNLMGLSSTPALVALRNIAPANSCCRFIRPRSPKPSKVLDLTYLSESTPSKICLPAGRARWLFGSSMSRLVQISTPPKASTILTKPTKLISM